MEKKFFIKRAHFGEILQGIYPSYSIKNRCIITFPIEINSKKKKFDLDFLKYSYLYSYIKFKENNKLIINKKKFSKSFNLIKNYEKNYKHKIKGIFKFYNNIPIERGMGSSSVDLITIFKILKKIKNNKISKTKIYEMCCKIEATDPLLENKVTIFSTVLGKNVFTSKLKFPSLKIFSFDTNWKKKGIKTDKVKTPGYSKKELKFFEESFNSIKKMKNFNLKIIKKISSGSLNINQKYYPKKNFNKIINIANKIKNSFVVGAHSGTMIGIVFKSNYSLSVNDIKNLKSISKILKCPISKYKSID